MRFVCVICLVFLFCDAGAQVMRTNGARAAACGGCVSVMTGPESFSDNPAALAKQRTSLFFLNAANGYLLPASTDLVAGGAVAAFQTNLSLGIAYHGDSFFHETTVSTGASKCLFRTLLVGVRIKYHSLFLGEEYARIRSASADVGLVWELSDKAAFGLYLYNPFSVSFGQNSLLTGISGVATGVLFHTGPHSLVITEIEKMSQRPVNLKAGMEWNFAKCFAFRCGAQYATRTISFGCGFLLNNIKVNIAICNSMIPGSQFAFGTLYEFQKR